jgi:hypothetical protein
VADEREVVRARLDALERQRKFLDRGGTPPSAAAKSPATATATATAATARTAATSAAKSSPVRVSVGSDSAPRRPTPRPARSWRPAAQGPRQPAASGGQVATATTFTRTTTEFLRNSSTGNGAFVADDEM